jgi:hypothetical protein
MMNGFGTGMGFGGGIGMLLGLMVAILAIHRSHHCIVDHKNEKMTKSIKCCTIHFSP